MDVFDGSLKEYDREGSLHRVVRRKGTGPHDFNRPNSLAIDGRGGVWLKDGSSHFVLLRRDLEPTKSVATGDLEPGPNGVARAFFDWEVVGDRLYALGDLLVGEESRRWQRGWIEMDLQNPHTVRRILPAPADDAVHTLHRLGYPYVASEDDRAYFLVLEEGGGSIWQVAPRLRRLDSFPAGFDRLPHPPPSRGAETTELIYGFLESTSYPAGLYAWGGRLFVLTRAPAGPGTTRWTLHEIDPGRDELTRTIRLPTDAQHLTVVPGPTYWALVEKGSVEVDGRVPDASAERVTFLAASLFAEGADWPDDPCGGRVAEEGRHAR